MKCPFRTIITKQNIYGEGDKSGKVITAVTSEEFADCIKNDCPYYNDLYNIPCKKTWNEL